MKKMVLFISLILLIGFFLSSCKKTDNNPILSSPESSVYVSSVPASAQIWLVGTDKKKLFRIALLI